MKVIDRKIETYMSFDWLYVKKYIILIYSVFMVLRNVQSTECICNPNWHK
jgi:hypothetical protein